MKDENGTCQQLNSFQACSSMSSASQSINSLPNVRVFFGFLFPLFSIFDDYWYYSYHNRDYKNLFITATFFQMIQDVNN